MANKSEAGDYKESVLVDKFHIYFWVFFCDFETLS